MSEFSLLERSLSQSSKDIANSNESNSESIIALNAIRVAYYSNRINDDEKLYLKNYVKDTNIMIDDVSILNKLDEGERIALLSVARSPTHLMTSERLELIRLRKRYHKEVSSDDKKAVIDTVNNGICCVCGDEKSKSEGITCSEGHFFCNEDLTAWVSSINEEKELHPDLFRKRKGRICCPEAINMTGTNSVMCPSESFSHAIICKHIVDEDVLEKYIEGIKHIQGLDLFANYQLQVLNEIENFKAEVMIDTPSDIGNKIERLEKVKIDRQKLIERQAKKMELVQLAQSLKVLHPDARQCLVCGFGPLLKFKCDDLLLHHLKPVSNDSSSSTMYDNSCPQCKAAPPSNWKNLPTWNGKLPASYLSEEIDDVEFANFTANSYSWSQILQEFCFLSDDIAKQCEINICSKTKYIDIDTVFKCRQDGIDIISMLAEIEIEERRLELVSAKLFSTLDVMFKVMNSFNMKSSSSIKSLINKKDLLFKVVPNTGGTDILDYLDINCNEIETISKTCSDNERSYENDSIFDKEQSNLAEIEKINTDDLLTRREKKYLLSKAYIPVNNQHELEDVAIEDIFYLQHKLELSLPVVSLISPTMLSESPFIEIDRNALNAILEKLPTNSDSVPALTYGYDHHIDDNSEGDVLNATFTTDNHPSHYDISERLQAFFPISIGDENACNLLNFIKENPILIKSKLISFDSHSNYRDDRSNDWMNDSALLTNPNVDFSSDLDWAKPSIDMLLTYAIERFSFQPFLNFHLAGKQIIDTTATNDSLVSRDAPQDSTNAPQDSINVPQDSTNVPQDSTNVPQDSTNTLQDIVSALQDIMISDTNTPQVTPQVIPQTNNSSIEDIIDEDLERFCYRAGVVFISPKCFSNLRSFIENRIKDIIDIAEFDVYSSNLKKKNTILAVDIQRALRESLSYPSAVVFGFGIDGLRHLWFDFIFKVLKQIHPSMEIRVKAAAVIGDMITWTLRTILYDAQQSMQVGKEGFITEQNVIHSLKKRYCGALFKHAESEVKKAITKYSTHHKMWYFNKEGLLESESPVNIGTMSGLSFDPHLIYSLIRRLYPDKFKITVEGLIAVTASIEYIVAEVLELSGNCCNDIRANRAIAGSKSIDTRDIYLAVFNDTELNVTFANAIFMNSGNMNHFNPNVTSILNVRDEDSTTFDLLLENVSDENSGRLIIDSRTGIPHENAGQFFHLFEQLTSYSRTRLKYQAQKKLPTDLNEMISSFEERNILNRLKRLRKIINKEQGQTNYCVSFATWRSIIMKYAKSCSNNDNIILTEEAYHMVATATESQLVRLLSKSNDLANHANRIIVLPSDITKSIESLTRRTD